MATETQLLKLDLDSKDFDSKLDVSDAKMSQLTDPSKVTGLSSALATVGPILGVLGVAAIAAKAALDLTMEAESVKSVNAQFELLTKNAGISGAALKDALVTAADGLVDDTDLLGLANEAVVKLGSSAQRLPEIFELARNVTRTFGGDLTDRFKQINDAVAAGNVRALRSVGLIIDQDAALRKYAASVGVTVDALSEQERKTAILNATLEKGRTAFAGVSSDTLQTTESFRRLVVALGQLKEIAAVAFEKVFGGFMRTQIQGVGAMVQDFTRFLTDKFGSGPEAAQAKIERLTATLNESGARVFDLQTSLEKTSERMKAGTASTFEYANAQAALNKAQAEYSAIQAQIKGLRPEADRGPAGGNESAAIVAQDQEAADKRLAIQTKFEADLNNLRMARVQGQIETATTEGQVVELQKEREWILSEQTAAKIAQLDAQVALGKMTQTQANLQRYEIEQEAETKLANIRAKYEDERLKALQNFAAASRSVASGFAAGFKSAAANASKDMGDFSKLGQTAFSSFQSNAANAFMELGKGTKDAADVMKGFFLNALADIAQSQGTIMLANIFNPAAMAAGAGLLVLAGLLRSMAGSAGGGAGGGGSIGATSASSVSGGAGSSVGTDFGIESRPELVEKKRDVSLIVQGNYFETEQTKRTLMEMIRSETDATGFSYVQIGQGA